MPWLGFRDLAIGFHVDSRLPQREESAGGAWYNRLRRYASLASPGAYYQVSASAAQFELKLKCLSSGRVLRRSTFRYEVTGGAPLVHPRARNKLPRPILIRGWGSKVVVVRTYNVVRSNVVGLATSVQIQFCPRN